MKNKLIRSIMIFAVSAVTAAFVSAAVPVTVNAEENAEPYTVFVAVGANEDWSMCYAGENYVDAAAEINPGISVTPATISPGATATVSLSFDTPVDYIWYMTPVLVGKDITEAEFSVTLYINGTETSLDTEGKDNWWYESTGMFDESSAVRIYGGYNEFDDSHKYADHDALTSVSEIKYVITANNINGETGGVAAPELEVVDENPAGEPVVSEPVASDVPTETPAASEGGEQKKDTGLKAAKVIAGVVIMLAGACYAVILVRKMKR